jgi:hypothetical protein
MLRFILFFSLFARPYLWFLYICILRILKMMNDDNNSNLYYFLNRQYLWYTSKTDYFMLEESSIEFLLSTLFLSTLFLYLAYKLIN